jgi:spore germination protein (amino acid permease)
MGMAEGIALVFVVSFVTAFLSLPAEAIDTSGELGWFSVITAGGSTMIMLFLLIYVFQRIPGDLFSISKHLFGRPGAYLISAYYIIMFLALAALWTRQFAENTLLVALPSLNFQLAVGWYALGAAFIIYLGIENVARATYVILPFAVAGTLFVLGLLEPLYKPNYLFPCLGTGIAGVLIKGGVLVGANAGALLLAVLAESFQNARTLKAAVVFGLGGSVLLKSLSVLIFTMVFGASVAVEKTLPFFDMSRLIYLTRYVQRIESIFIILWVMVGILGIAVSLYMGIYLITRLVNLPAMKPLIPTVTILTAQLSMVPPDIGTIMELQGMLIRGYCNIGIYVIPFLLFAATLLKEKRGTKCTSG